MATLERDIELTIHERLIGQGRIVRRHVDDLLYMLRTSPLGADDPRTAESWVYLYERDPQLACDVLSLGLRRRDGGGEQSPCPVCHEQMGGTIDDQDRCTACGHMMT